MKKGSLRFLYEIVIIGVIAGSVMGAELYNCESYGSEMDRWIDDGIINYPISCDDEEWKILTYSEQKQMAMYPGDLSLLTTEDIIRLALDYPFNLDFLCFNSFEEGLEHLKSTSNVIAELYNRENIVEKLLNKYSDTNVNYSFFIKDDYNEIIPEQEKELYLDEMMIQLFLGSNGISDKMSNAEKQRFASIIEEKYKDVEMYSQLWSSHLFMQFMEKQEICFRKM